MGDAPMSVKQPISHTFDGQQMTVKQINAKYPAYSDATIRSALANLSPPANCRADLDRWCYQRINRAKTGGTTSAKRNPVGTVKLAYGKTDL